MISTSDSKVPIEETIGFIAEYVKAGKLGGISLSEVSATSIRKAHGVHPISAVEVEFSLWSTDILDNGIATTCAELGIPLIAYSPLGRGFLVSIPHWFSPYMRLRYPDWQVQKAFRSGARLDAPSLPTLPKRRLRREYQTS